MGERLNTESLRYVRAVAETGSFSAAARAYGVTQPALSNGIARLEAALAEHLFERTPRGVHLTAFGHHLLPAIEAAVDGLDALAAEAERWMTPSAKPIRMGVSPLINPKLIARAYGAVRSLDEREKPRELVLREANLSELQQALICGDLDLIVVPSVGPMPRFEHRVIDAEQVALVEADATSDVSIELREITGRQLIMVPDACGLTRFTRDLLASRDLPVRTYPGEALSYRVLEEWSMLGLGAALLPISRVTEPMHRPVIDEGIDVEIFYEAVWDPASGLARELSGLTSLMMEPSARMVA